MSPFVRSRLFNITSIILKYQGFIFIVLYRITPTTTTVENFRLNMYMETVSILVFKDTYFCNSLLSCYILLSLCIPKRVSCKKFYIIELRSGLNMKKVHTV